MHSLWSDEQAVFYTNFPYIPDVKGCQERLTKMLSFYAKTSQHFGPYTIRSEDGTFLGLAGGDASDLEQQVYEIWYFIQRPHWGRKVATAAVSELLSMMSSSGRVRRIKAEAVVDNEPSWKFLESQGFKRKERLTGAHKKDGRVFDRYVYHYEIPDNP